MKNEEALFTNSFSIIAHDLKSPFSGLLGISEFMVSDYDELTESEKREFLINMNNVESEINKGTTISFMLYNSLDKLN